jgi:hypothetical protein
VHTRTGSDKNPRNAYTFGGLQDRCLKPRGHPSISACVAARSDSAFLISVVISHADLSCGQMDLITPETAGAPGPVVSEWVAEVPRSGLDPPDQ